MRTVTGKIKVVNDKERNSKYVTMSDVDGNPKSCIYRKWLELLKNYLKNKILFFVEIFIKFLF